jgi:uncharacterized protein YndB with AHSA1/START domain
MVTQHTWIHSDMSSEQMAHNQFVVAVTVAADAAHVWAVMTDVERWPEWTASIRSIRLRDPGPLRVGTRALIRQPGLLPALWKVVSVEPGRAFTWRTGSPGFWAYGAHSVEPAGSASRVTLAVTYEGALAWLLTRLVGGLTTRYLRMEAAGLKCRSEQAELR